MDHKRDLLTLCGVARFFIQPVSFVEWKAKIPMGDEDAYTYSGVAGFSFGSLHGGYKNI